MDIIELLATVKAANLIFISGCGLAVLSANEGKSGFIHNLVKEIISCLSAQTCAYFMEIMTAYTLLTFIHPLSAYAKSRMFCRLLNILKPL